MCGRVCVGRRKPERRRQVAPRGHASLIRTIIGGAQIIDLMILVIDVTKGIQTQTAECLVIGEITCSKMIVVLNKLDLVPVENREKAVEKVFIRLVYYLETIFRTSFCSR